MIKLKELILEGIEEPFAIFVLVMVGGGYAATTRAEDRGETGRIGLPGGKIDSGEDYIEAAYRESREEGWEVTGIDPEIIHKQLVDGKMIYWVKAKSAKMLFSYKEKGRITPIVATREEVLKSGYGNENLNI